MRYENIPPELIALPRDGSAHQVRDAGWKQ